MPRLLLFLALLLPLAACQETPEDQPPDASIPFRADGTLTFVRGGEPITRIRIEIAESDSARTRGLMQRPSLPDSSGMLFVFPEEGPQSFWMANTPLSLDLFFASADSQIVHVAKYAAPYSPDPIASEAPAQYVVEVPAGFADTHGIVEGDRITWTRR